MSETGLEHVDDIVEAFFQYVKMLCADGIQEWVFEGLAKCMAALLIAATECQQLYQMQFRFLSKAKPAGYVRTLSRGLHYYPAENVVNSHFCLEEYKPGIGPEPTES